MRRLTPMTTHMIMGTPTLTMPAAVATTIITGTAITTMVRR